MLGRHTDEAGCVKAKVLFLLLLFPLVVQSRYLVDMGGGNVFTASTNRCSDVLSALNVYLGNLDFIAMSCDTDPVVPPFPRVIRFSNGMTWEIQGMTQEGTAAEGCVPSVRTVTPCPSGYAPAVMVPIDDSQPDPYKSEFDAMSIQDILYSMGICFFAVIGIGVGIKLV
jgi:hypothetical protein